MRIKWLLILMVCLLNSLAIAQEQNTGNPFVDKPDTEESWSKVKESNRVVMYSRDKEKRVVEGAKYKEWKGVVTINTTINSIIRLLEDTEVSPKWMHNCVSGEKISEDDAKNESIKHFKTVDKRRFRNMSMEIRHF